jgi:hypothetical protein
MAFTFSTQTSYKLGFIASVLVGLKLLFDVATLPNSFSEALTEADKVTVSYSLVHGRAQLDGGRPLKLRYEDAKGSKTLLSCSPSMCDRLPSFGTAEVIHVRAALFVPTNITLSLSVNGVNHTFSDAIARFRASIWGVFALCAFGAVFSLFGWKASEK